MEFLENNQICWWAEQRGLRRGDAFQVHLPELEAHPPKLYAQGHRSGHEVEAARDLVAGLGVWAECLVWITLWEVWPSKEDWPEFYAWRGAQGEKRSLNIAPGHQFDRTEVELLIHLLTLAMANAWDADILCSRDGRADQLRAKISHDEWYQLFGTT
jgi:hypothetical protein